MLILAYFYVDSYHNDTSENLNQNEIRVIPIETNNIFDNKLIMKSQEICVESKIDNSTPSGKTIKALKSQPNLLNSPCHYVAKQK